MPGKEQELTNLKNVFCIQLDVTKPETIEQATNGAIKKFGRIDALVNNAGYGAVDVFEAASSEQIKRQHKTNVFGLMAVMKAVLPYFRSQKSGTIINISSMAGRTTFPLYGLYKSTKWAVEGFSEAVHFELEPFNIRVKIVEPGVIKTDFAGRSAEIISDPKKVLIKQAGVDRKS